MAKSQETFNKKEKEKKRLKKRQDKLVTKEERKASSQGGSLESMMAYVDEFGNISDTPPDPNVVKKKINASSIEIGIPKRTDEPQETGRQGKVTYFNDSKGYGFIKDLMTQENVFVHVNGLTEEIAENDMVTFEVERGIKGMNAVRVKKFKPE
jgi:cold shock CspA family protein